MTTDTVAADENSCEHRIDAELAERLSDLRRLWELYCEGDEWDDELGSLHEYGLAFDYVEPGTFEGQREGYWRYQLSWGGPSDEFRFYVSPGGKTPYRVEYRFMDWFDGASRDMSDLSIQDQEILRDLWKWFEAVWGSYDYDEGGLNR